MQDSTKRTFIDWGPIIFVLLLLSIGGLMFFTIPKKGDVIVINCSISEFSPDFTTEMREACRQAQAKNISKDLYKPK